MAPRFRSAASHPRHKHSKGTRLVLAGPPDAARREMQVNYFGVLNMTRAFAPILGANGGGHIAAVLSVAGAFPAPFMGGYSTAPIGPDTYVEVLAPTVPEHSVARWLRRAGGSSGWVLSTQVPSLAGVRERAADLGVRVAVDTQALCHDIIQLHPLDIGGVLLELDEFLPRGGWFWDDMEAARTAQAGRSAKVDNIVAVDVAADEPATMAALWAAIVGIDPPAATADGAQIAFSSRTIRFVPVQGGRTGIVAVDMHATDRRNGVGASGQLCGTLIRFV